MAYTIHEENNPENHPRRTGSSARGTRTPTSRFHRAGLPLDPRTADRTMPLRVATARRRSSALPLAGLLACAALAFATPVLAQVNAPGAPEGLEAVPGDRKVTLNWKEPESDGGAPITDYEYRYKSMGNSYPPWIAVPGADLLIGAGLDAYLIQPGLDERHRIHLPGARREQPGRRNAVRRHRRGCYGHPPN